MGWRDDAEVLLIRAAMTGLVPGRWFCRRPPPQLLAARSGQLQIEIVSHCWQYAHLLAYQLSSLVNHAPTAAAVTMTVFHAREDERTVATLQHFGRLDVPGVRWNWQTLEPGELFRRSIGRNRVARATSADWVWFTDCDIVFHQHCLDTLAAALQGRRDPMVYPRQERVTEMLDVDDVLLTATGAAARVVDIEPGRFTLVDNPPKAKGAYQIVHGDLARACGYCEQLGVFQRPASRWAKTYEDSAYRWLVGADGVGIDVPGVYRIRHVHKGRYGDNSSAVATLRSGVRRAKSGLTGH